MTDAFPAAVERAGVAVELRDGSVVRVRQIRPSDRERLVRGFDRLSPESRYRRFLTQMPQLAEAPLRYLTEVDHHGHEAIVALDKAGVECLGVARYVRHPGRPEAAEVAVTVADDWQGRGLGTLLLDVISARARDEGVCIFTALVLAHNREMIDLLKRELGPVRIVDRAAGTVELEVEIPAVGVPPALQRLLRVAAREEVAVSLRERPPTPGG